MKRFLWFLSVAIFSVFIGSQITEGALLVPYWQSLPASDFYAYYNEFGPSIASFYTVLTIMAALIPIGLAVYARRINSRAFSLALISTFFAVLFVASFYLYFKGANELFYQSALSATELKSELITWSTWHWGRIVVEGLSLLFLILALVRIQETEDR